ncbi:MAG: DUF1499 domain-containing protein [Cyanobacteria bacterium P01_H01_bin.121]
MFKFAGQRPTSLGVKEGQLSPCPSSPNCVCSQATSDDSVHYVAPIPYTGSAETAIAKLKTIVTGLPRTEIIEATENYLYAEFTSQLMGYVDDVEFYADEATKTLQMRSASRLGKSDLGVNRTRITEIQQAFLATSPGASS